MKKLLCVVPALLLFVMIGAPNAHADTYTPTFTCQPAGDCPDGLPTAPNVTFAQGEPTAVSVTAAGGLNPLPVTFNLSLPVADAPGDAYTWSFLDLFNGDTLFHFFSIDDETNGLEVSEPFSLNNDVAEQGSLTFTPVSAAAPEPAPILFMMLGGGLIFFMRRRFVMRIPRTA